jgi:alpha-beta hydrolase superfamily lysophospholipase
MMQETTFRHADGYVAHVRYWPGVRGAVLMLHGIQSHGGWFERSAIALAEAGYAVLLPDRRGSGRNSAARGDITNYRRWVGDAVELAKHLTTLSQRPKVHVVGISWGGKLAAAAARYFPDVFESVAMVAPGIFPAVDVAGSLKMQIILAAVAGSAKPFEIPLSEPTLFTHNVERQAYIASDALRLTHATGRFLCQSALLDRHVRRLDQQYACPIKLYLAEHERIIDNAKTLALFRSWRAPMKRLSYFENASHTLEFEPDPKAYFDDLIGWFQEAH